MSQIEEAAAQAAEIPAATAPTPAAGVSPRMSWVILRRLVLWTITWICVVGLILVWVTGCTQRNVELPDNSGEGSDLMLKSPCACQQLENGRACASTPVTNAPLVCRFVLEKKNTKSTAEICQ